MTDMPNLQVVERRAWTLYFQDGLWDIFLGLLFLGGGLRSLTGNRWFYLLIAAGVLALILGKRWITVPRLGQINFSPQRKARQNVLRVAIFAVVLLTAALALWTALPAGWIFVVLVPGIFLLMAYMMDFKRLYFYSVLIAAFMVITEVYGDPLAAWAQIVAGLVPLTVGLVLLVRFLRHYPVLDEASLLETGNNGNA
jgi:hypothetical protein